MSAWDKVGGPQEPYTARQRARGKGMRRCPRCKGCGEVPGLIVTCKRCPRCQGEGQIETRATVRKRKRMQRDWDAKQRQANARPKERLR